MNTLIKNSDLPESSNIYNGASLIDSIVGEMVSIGDYSKVNNSRLDNSVRIDRNNHVDSSIFGAHSYTGKNTIVLHAKIGAFTSISWNVSLGGADHDYSRACQHSMLYNDFSGIRPDEYSKCYDRYSQSLSIGNDVWIAAGAVITRGVTISDGAVIGANSVVTRDVPPYAIVAGSPAKIIKYRFDNEIIELMMKLKWWDWPIEKIKENYSILADYPTKDALELLLEQE